MSRIILAPDIVIDGSGAAPMAGQAVVIDDEIIAQVAPISDLSTADRDTAIRLAGKTVIPGLINNHVHLVLPGDNTPFVPWIDLQSDASLALMATHNIQTSLRAGVTTVRDCGGRREVILDVRNARVANLIDGAAVISCGWTLTITGGHTRQFGGEVDGEVDLARAVRKVISRGADYVKVMAAGGGTPGTFSQYPSFTESELRAIVETAHGLGKLVCAHCIATSSIENAINAGVDLIEHASFFGPSLIPQFDQRVAEKLAASGIPVTPTLQVNRDLVDLLDEGDERTMWQRRQETQRKIVHKLQEFGVPLLAGSDAGWRATAFDTFWKELDELVECGLRPVDAIHAATGAVTVALGYDDFGTIRPGQRADVVVVDGDLTSDIRALQQVEMVIQHGKIAYERSVQA